MGFRDCGNRRLSYTGQFSYGEKHLKPPLQFPESRNPKLFITLTTEAVFVNPSRLGTSPQSGLFGKIAQISAKNMQELVPDRKQSKVNRRFTLCVKKYIKTEFQASPREDDADQSPDVSGT
jgi:hypothetical protein